MSNQRQSTHNQPEFTVSEISTRLKQTVEEAFSYVRIRGEISGFKRASSGHVYFSLKDEHAVLNAVCWRGTSEKLAFKPEDGLEVICVGKISTYPGRSNYQIVCDWIEPAGLGALMALLEKRKKQLAAEGLFDEARKKPLPFLPHTIGVVTSPTGAVIRDILHRLNDRFPRHVLVWPVLVQGEGAAEQITAAIEGFNRLDNKPDIIIVARGGGSLEDLWAFNEENVVRMAAASHIPLISAVGHETDTTLIDFVSDRRAPTPTAAAEMAVPVRDELRSMLKDVDQRLYNMTIRLIDNKQHYLEGLIRGLVNPKQLVENMVQRLDDWSERLQQSLPNILSNKLSTYTALSERLKPHIILKLLILYEEQLVSYGRLLESFHYKRVLERGFVLVRNTKEKLVHSAKSAASHSSLMLEFHDGNIAVKTEQDVTFSSPDRIQKKKKGNEDQGSLF